MVFTPVEIIAGLFALLVLVKLIVVLVNKELWYRAVAEPVYSSQGFGKVLFGATALILFYFLIQELKITHVFASMALMATVVGFFFMHFPNDFAPVIKRFYERKLEAWQYFYALIWIALALWVLYEAFVV